jgi:hypothetical protein
MNWKLSNNGERNLSYELMVHQKPLDSFSENLHFSSFFQPFVNPKPPFVNSGFEQSSHGLKL